MRSLGLSEAHVNLAWLAGPISGAVVQPIVGFYSDGCVSAMGKRRPFILGAVLAIVFSLILFGNAEQLGYYFGDKRDGDNTVSHAVGLPIAIGSFWILDCSINIMQAPLRALLSDTVPKHQQTTGRCNKLISTGAQ